MLFRASYLPQPLPEWFAGVFSGDYTLQLLITRTGNALYLPRLMSCYRIHETGITTLSLRTEAQLKSRIYEGKMFQQHVFDAENRKRADIYLAHKYLGYYYFLGTKGRR